MNTIVDAVASLVLIIIALVMWALPIIATVTVGVLTLFWLGIIC